MGLMAGIVSGGIALKRDGTCVQQRQRLAVTNTSTTLLYILAAGSPRYYATFFPARTFAHRARCAAAILFLPTAEIVRLPRFAAIETTFPALTLAHRAFCARLIRLRAETDMVRLRRAPLPADAEPFSPTKRRITSSNFSTRNSACLCSSRICWSAFCRFDIVTPSGIVMRSNCIGGE